MLIAIIVVVVLVAIVGFVVVGFNKLRTTDIGAQEALGGIDVQLTRRADLIPNLVETVKGYAAHEKGVFEEVTRARTAVATAAKGDDVPAKAAADAELQPGPGQGQRGRRGLPRPQGQHELPRAAEAARRHREPDLLRPPVLQRRRGDAQQADPDDPVDVPHRHRRTSHKRDFYDAPDGAGRRPDGQF